MIGNAEPEQMVDMLVGRLHYSGWSVRAKESRCPNRMKFWLESNDNREDQLREPIPNNDNMYCYDSYLLFEHIWLSYLDK